MKTQTHKALGQESEEKTHVTGNNSDLTKKIAGVVAGVTVITGVCDELNAQSNIPSDNPKTEELKTTPFFNIKGGVECDANSEFSKTLPASKIKVFSNARFNIKDPFFLEIAGSYIYDELFKGKKRAVGGKLGFELNLPKYTLFEPVQEGLKLGLYLKVSQEDFFSEKNFNFFESPDILEKLATEFEIIFGNKFKDFDFSIYGNKTINEVDGLVLSKYDLKLNNTSAGYNKFNIGADALLDMSEFFVNGQIDWTYEKFNKIYKRKELTSKLGFGYKIDEDSKIALFGVLKEWFLNIEGKQFPDIYLRERYVFGVELQNETRLSVLSEDFKDFVFQPTVGFNESQGWYFKLNLAYSPKKQE